MSTLELSHWDYDKKEKVIDGQVGTYAIARALTPETLADLLEDYANNFSSSFKRGKTTGHKLRSSHRTLQRSVIVECVGIIAGLAEQEYTDARNETAIHLAKQIAAIYDEIGAGWFI